MFRPRAPRSTCEGGSQPDATHSHAAQALPILASEPRGNPRISSIPKYCVRILERFWLLRRRRLTQLAVVNTERQPPITKIPLQHSGNLWEPFPDKNIVHRLIWIVFQNNGIIFLEYMDYFFNPWDFLRDCGSRGYQEKKS